MDNTKKLGSEEFTDTLLELVSTNILSNNYIEAYEEFTNNLFFALWKEYYFSENDLPIRHYANLVEIFFINLFTYESSSDKDVEVTL